jgi:hypothetical protein
VSPATALQYVPETNPDPSRQQHWMTIFRTGKDVIAGMDFFVGPSVEGLHHR